MTVWSVEAVQVRVTESCTAEAWRFVGWAGGLAPVAAAVAVTSWFWAWTTQGMSTRAAQRAASPMSSSGERRKTPGGGHDLPPASRVRKFREDVCAGSP